jgi:predicted dehydrogenase
MAIVHGAENTFSDYDAMLADPAIDAVIIATADAFHVPASLQALAAGKHVLCEKPIGVTIEETEALKEAVVRSGKVLQVGHMKRFDAGIQSAKAFIDTEMGDLIALKAWYCDSTHRYSMTDAVQPLIVTSANARKPATNPKANLRKYYMLAHGCHLIDTARYLAGDVTAVRARLSERSAIWCWFVDVEFASGALGHLDLTVAVRMDWHEGFQIYGKNGSIAGKIFNPWYYKTSEVDIFRESDGSTHRVLGADGHFYRRQVEGFADVILNGAPQIGATIDDGIASVRGMVAIARSVETGRRIALADVLGGV